MLVTKQSINQSINQGCGTAFQLVLGRTSAMNSLRLFVWALRSRRILTVCLNCASLNFLTYLLTHYSINQSGF